MGVPGPLEVTRGGVQVRLPRAQERRLLAALAIHAGESVSTDALVEALWPGEEQPERPARALRTIVSQLVCNIGGGNVAKTVYRASIYGHQESDVEKHRNSLLHGSDEQERVGRKR